MGEFDFLEPIPKTTMAVKLPSRGVPYPKEHPASSGKLTLAPMTMLEEALFLSDDQDLTETVDKVLRRCVQEKIDINNLITSDKFFLFMMLRAITYGSDYLFEWVCKATNKKGKLCNATNSSSIHIPDDFKMKFLTEEDKEPFVVMLPETKRQISFRLLRGSDEPRVEKHSKEIEQARNSGAPKIDTTVGFRLMCHIVAVDGKSVTKAPEEKLLGFILSLPAKDRQFLQQKINFYTPGLNTDVTVVCDSCGAVTTMDMPFTSNFFRSSLPDEESSGTPNDEV